MSVVVFLGPSLPRSEAEAILAADYRGPVRQGDVYRLVKQRRPSAIAVIDGFFQEVPSVWHKEILWALDQGIPVYGAASMGALRAAELERYGMVGIGKIYEAYSSGRYAPYDDEAFEDDDEVAVIHGPAALAYPALSDAMVDLRETFAEAERQGVIDAALRDSLAGAFKQRFYRERSLAALPEVLAVLEVAPGAAEALQAWLRSARVFQKQADARALLERLAAEGPALPEAREPFNFERTTLWAQFVEQPGDSPALTAPEQQVLEELRLDPQAYGRLRDAAVLRLSLDAGEPVAPPDQAARLAALDRLRKRHGLWSRESLESWAAESDLDRDGFDRLLDFEAALEATAEAGGAALESALLDVLRREDRYRALAERARDKEQRLAAAGLSASAPSARSQGPLLDWYFEDHLGIATPSDLPAYAEDLGFEGVEALLAAVARERAYLGLCDDSSAVAGG